MYIYTREDLVSIIQIKTIHQSLLDSVDTNLCLAQPELQHLQGLADHVGLLFHQDSLLVLLQAAERAQQTLQDGVVLLLQSLQALDNLLGPRDDLILGQLLPRVLLLHTHHGGHVLTHPADFTTSKGECRVIMTHKPNNI